MLGQIRPWLLTEGIAERTFLKSESKYNHSATAVNLNGKYLGASRMARLMCIGDNSFDALCRQPFKNYGVA